MDLNSLAVWLILVVGVMTLGFVGFWFNLRTLRWFTFVIAVVLAIAITHFGVTHPEYSRANLVDSFLSGVDQVTIALLHPLWPGGKVPAPGDAGRWIIAVALLLGYRQLEGWTLRWQAPGLDLSALGQGRPTTDSAVPAVAVHGRRIAARAGGPTASQLHAKLAAELRFRLPTMEVRSPAILPGGARTSALASIAETSGVSGAGMVSAVLRFAGMIWPSPRSIKVQSWVEDATGTKITVLLEDAKTGLAIATKTVAGDCFDEAASMVAGYIARQIFAMDRTVPEWCYGMADGRDLGAMQLVRLERVYAACPKDVTNSRDEQIKILSSSTGSVRTAGIVRYELAQLLALQGQHLESLRQHALNRELHDRFYRGRYRLAMSLEMIANPEHYLPNDKATWDKLGEILQILSRCGLVDEKVKVSAEILTDKGPQEITAPPCGYEAPPCMRVSHGFAMELLQAAAKDLRQVRAQLSAWHVMRDTLIRRDERAVWLPHWRPRHRQAFQDGVCVAELLIAIRCRLRELDGADSGWLQRARDRRHLRRATRITSFIAGAPAFINKLQAGQDGHWCDVTASKAGPSVPQARTRVRHRVRWLPWQRRTPSWQAAYNTACLYAALTDAAREKYAALTDEAREKGASLEEVQRNLEELKKVQRNLEGRVIASLRRAVEDPHTELERPSDWIHSDPDFHVIDANPLVFTKFCDFLCEQMHQDYPVAFMAGQCPVSHTPSVRTPAAPEGRLIRVQPPIHSPVRRPVDTRIMAEIAWSWLNRRLG
jgi:hypothetical protein